jgi:hypothetical protein
MAYRNKLYTTFDGDTDMWAYRMLQAWAANGSIDFSFYNAHDLNTARDGSLTESIKEQLRERLRNSKLMLILVGENTKGLRKFVPWEIESAHKRELPIVVANLNGKRKYDPDRCPTAVLDGDTYTVHVSYERAIIKHALEHFADDYGKYKSDGNAQLVYSDKVYTSLGL